MLALAADLDEIAALADGIGDGHFLIQLSAELIEVGYRQLGTELDGTGIRLDFAEDELDQSGLADAVRADQADLVTALDHAVEIADQHAPAVGFAHVLQLGHALAGFFTAIDVEVDLAQMVAALAAFAAQLFEAAHPAFVTRAPRLDALAQPYFFLRQHLVEFGLLDRFDRQLLGLEALVFSEITLVGAQHAAIQLDNLTRHIVQKAPVMGNHDHATVVGADQLFQPLDRRQVEVVGGLVEQQQVWLGDQRPRQRHAFFQAARQGANQHVFRQTQLGQRGFHARLQTPAVTRFQRRLQRLHARHQRVEIGVRLAHLVRDVVIIEQQLAHRTQPIRDFLKHTVARIQFRLLRHISQL